MPIIKSAMKRAKQAVVRRSRNLQVKRAVKADTLAVHTALTVGDATEVQTKLGAAYSEIDRAVRKHTLHKNTAARRKAQLAAAVAKASSDTPDTSAADEAVAKAKGTGVKAGTSKSTAKKAAAKKPSAKTASKPAAKKVAAAKAEPETAK